MAWLTTSALTAIALAIMCFVMMARSDGSINKGDSGLGWGILGFVSGATGTGLLVVDWAIRLYSA